MSLKVAVCSWLGLAAVAALGAQSSPLDRPGIVGRHNPALHAVNSSEVLVLGNGAFALSVDVTGLQSLNDTAFSGEPRGSHEPDYCRCPVHADVRWAGGRGHP